MHVGGVPVACRAHRGGAVCGSALWLEDEQLEPIANLLIGVVSCLRCGAAYIYARYPDGWVPAHEGDE